MKNSTFETIEGIEVELSDDGAYKFAFNGDKYGNIEGGREQAAERIRELKNATSPMFELKKFHHESGKGIYALSKRVNPLQHKQLAEDMAKWLSEENGKFRGEFSNAYAISHCQVAEEPIAMFVVAPQLVGRKEGRHTQRNFFFPAAAIFNAEIVEAPEEVKAKVPNRVIAKNPETGKDEMQVQLMEQTVTNKAYLKEACMSFSHRSEKTVERFLKIKVRYWYLWHGIPMRRTEWVEGLKAHIFQHELDHAAGKNIYFK